MIPNSLQQSVLPKNVPSFCHIGCKGWAAHEVRDIRWPSTHVQCWILWSHHLPQWAFHLNICNGWFYCVLITDYVGVLIACIKAGVTIVWCYHTHSFLLADVTARPRAPPRQNTVHGMNDHLIGRRASLTNTGLLVVRFRHGNITGANCFKVTFVYWHTFSADSEVEKFYCLKNNKWLSSSGRGGTQIKTQI